MPFLSPALLLLFLPVGGAITVLYLLRLRRRDVTVSSVMLWKTALQESQANTPFQKLRRNLLLALQLLAALLLVAAVARPFLRASGLGGKTTALILDGSASMKATDEAGSRFAGAVRQASALIRRKAPGDAVAIVLAGGPRPVILSPLTTDAKALENALRRAKATDATGDMREALLLASSLVASRAEAGITILSDGAFGKLEAMTLGSVRLSFLTVGRRGENVAVTAFDVRGSGGNGARHEAFVTVQNFGRKARTFPLELRSADRLLDAHEITLRPGESRSEAFSDLPLTGGIVEARVDIRDDLASDDRAALVLPPRRAVRILLVSEGNPFLERVLNTDSRITLDAVLPKNYRASDSSAHDLTVFDNAAPPRALPPAGRYLFWGPKTLGGASTAVPAVAASGTQEMADRPQIVDWSRTHPVLRFVDLANVNTLRARNVALAPWGETLAETDAGPLIIAGERGSARAVYVGFSVIESDMPLRIAFPIFVANCVDWLSARSGETGAALRPGEVAALAAAAKPGTITVTRPDGGKDQVPVSPNAPPLYDRTDTAGIYHASGKDYRHTFAVSLLSPAESSIAPVAKPPVIVTAAAAANDPIAPHRVDSSKATVRREVWSYLALLALAALTVEWLVYHRRPG